MTWGGHSAQDDIRVTSAPVERLMSPAAPALAPAVQVQALAAAVSVSRTAPVAVVAPGR